MLDYLNVGLAFLEGIALIASPCVLPILPIILSGSLESGRHRPFGIIFGFVLTFALFTLFSKALVLYTGINLTYVRYASYIMLMIFGITMCSTYLSDKFLNFTYKLTRAGSSISVVNNTQSGFKGGLLLGSLVGIIWTPCAGPILAVVIVQTVLQQTNWNTFLIIVSFGLGVSIPMILIALFGRKIMDRLVFFKNYAYALRKLLGAIIIASVVYMFYAEAVSPVSAKSNIESPTQVMSWFSEPYPAPEVGGITAWINSSPLDLSQLKGKVILIDFWAYSCINCMRTLPFLNGWYQKYHDKGLVIIGVHAPEFQFEHDYANVKNAVEKFGIKYPVALDNNFTTWRNYNNQYWPAHYLIDKKGDVVYTHSGEGEYDVTENNIRYLLGLKGEAVSSKNHNAFFANQTPETYLGVSRANTFASTELIRVDKPSIYTFPKIVEDDHWALDGAWIISSEKIISAQSNAALKIRFNAGRIYIVMGNTTSQPVKVRLQLNGESIVREKGKDVVDSVISVNGHRLYEAVVLKHASNGILQVTASAPGLEIYTFTFGN